ncbi:MAG: amidohydrolase family protein, partial [Melioribacteraceae bacterium]|nr:amidohydrolase family protein [Melioribacteraceae bacterium]
MKIVNAWICQIDENKIEPIFGDIEISEGKIYNIISKDINDESNSAQSLTNAINAHGRVVTIPNVNYHDHIYSSLAKGLRLEGDFSNFYNILKNLWWKLDLLLDEDMIRASAQMTAIESIKKGITYIIDHHSSPHASENSLRTISEELENLGLRNILCFESTDRNGRELKEEGIKENINFLENYITENSKSMLGLHASFTLDDDTLKKAAELIREHDWSIHVHLCEDLSDIEESNRKYDSNPLKRFVDHNLLNSKSILAHGIHLNENEFRLVEESGAAIALNIDSNMNNSVGLHKYDLMYRNIPILIGTDGMHSNIPRSLKELFLQLRNYGLSFDDSFNFIINT